EKCTQYCHCGTFAESRRRRTNACGCQASIGGRLGGLADGLAMNIKKHSIKRKNPGLSCHWCLRVDVLFYSQLRRFSVSPAGLAGKRQLGSARWTVLRNIVVLIPV